MSRRSITHEPSPQVRESYLPFLLAIGGTTPPTRWIKTVTSWYSLVNRAVGRVWPNRSFQRIAYGIRGTLTLADQKRGGGSQNMVNFIASESASTAVHCAALGLT